MGSNLHQFVAGGVGGMAGVLAGHPLGFNLFEKKNWKTSDFEDTMKVRIQCSPGRLSMTACFKQIIAEHGVRGLYRGELLIKV